MSEDKRNSEGEKKELKKEGLEVEDTTGTAEKQDGTDSSVKNEETKSAPEKDTEGLAESKENAADGEKTAEAEESPVKSVNVTENLEKTEVVTNSNTEDSMVAEKDVVQDVKTTEQKEDDKSEPMEEGGGGRTVKMYMAALGRSFHWVFMNFHLVLWVFYSL